VQLFSKALFILLTTILFASADPLQILTLKAAHEAALSGHPRIKVGELLALASRERTREARSAFFPQLSGSIVAVGTAQENTRLAAMNGLNNSSVFERNAEGVMISQLITDFGRTANLVGTAKARAEAEAKSAEATKEQILLAVDDAYFGALQAQSVTRVARQTIDVRQVFLDRVSTLATNKLRSELDVDFARVNLADATLLLKRSQNDLQAAFGTLAALMGNPNPPEGSTNELYPFNYRLEEQPLPAGMSTNVATFVEMALKTRPDLLSLRFEHEAAHRFAYAERDARYPSISAIGSAGVVPIRDPVLPDSYAAAGLTMSIPIFAGGLYVARQHEAEIRAQAAAETVHDLENRIVRDVRIGWLNAENAYERLEITRELLENAKHAYELADARYKAGSSSIVELNQAQLNEVSAEITYAQTQYEYLIRRSALDFQTGTLH
jgi:outer membrane protein